MIIKALLETREMPEQEYSFLGYLIFACIKLRFPEMPINERVLNMAVVNDHKKL